MTEKLIKVQASSEMQEARTVVLFERHPDQPGGETFISGNDTIHTVAPTAAVKLKIHDGLLVEIGSKKPVPTKEGD